MAEVRELKVVLSYDDSQLKRGTADTQKSLSGLTSSIIKANITYDLLKKAVSLATDFIKDSIETYKSVDSALIALKSTANAFGVDIEDANQAALDLSEDGLLSIIESALSLRQLLSTGISLPKAIDLMKAYKDQAAFGRLSSITFGQAVMNLSGSFLTQNSMIGNASGQAENYNLIMELGAEKLGKRVSQLTRAEEIEARYIGTLIVAQKAQGDTARLAGTLQGAEIKLSKATTDLEINIGKAFAPAKRLLIEDIISAIKELTKSTGSSNTVISAWGIGFVNVLQNIATMAVNLGSLFLKGPIASLKDLEETNRKINEGMEENAKRAAEAITSVVDKESGRVKDIVENTGGAIRNDFEKTADTAAKETRKYADELEDITKSFNENLEDMLYSKREQRERLELELTKENLSYEQSLAKTEKANVRQDAKDKRQHEKSLKELQDNLDEEVAKGVEADQRRIFDLQEKILIENTEYQEALEEKKELRAEEATEEREQHQERITEIETTLNKLRSLEAKYAEDFAKIKDKEKEDDITRLKRKFEEEKAELLKRHNERKAELGTQGTAEANSYMQKSIDQVNKRAPELNRAVVNAYNVEPFSPFGELLRRQGVPGYQHGGTLPVTGLYLGHKGERVVPKTGADVAGSTSSTATVNFYGNLSVRSESDIDEIANKVSRVLGRQSELERWYG